ncbi:nitronate monooxygenase family protein [Odoribacter sp. Z80]|uniref:NAD(P)H-dependent flavin oxidoreductase n=1 Tax=Odoribacter sp. Z80 TaxID=2304575 RepID=UPI00137AFA9B|nr:nitronate monooxygenase [Odoribacter sp. Z80]NCE73038.1 nitronate monooxygenase [Odoribacter sp. Z80]
MNRITALFGIKYPIIQGGMVWCSGWRLASAVSNNGGLGLLGAGSMHPDTLLFHIRKMQTATNNPWGVNVPLLYPEIERVMELLIEEKVKIVFTSAGSPKKWTSFLKSHGITVVHVISSTSFAQKCEEAGCDAIVAEGFEAGGHNGREETTTLTLIPSVAAHCQLPLIAAGGIASGKAMLAAFALGAEGVQIGTRFAVASESSAHPDFKQRVFETGEGDTILSLKKLAPTRLIKNEFYEKVKKLEEEGAKAETLKELLGKGRAKQGIFEGNLTEGELEIGQIASMLTREEDVAEIIRDLIRDYRDRLNELSSLDYISHF